MQWVTLIVKLRNVVRSTVNREINKVLVMIISNNNTVFLCRAHAALGIKSNRLHVVTIISVKDVELVFTQVLHQEMLFVTFIINKS